MRLIKLITSVNQCFFRNKSIAFLGENITREKNFVEGLCSRYQSELNGADYILRSFLQYKCQTLNFSIGKIGILNIIALVGLLIFIPIALLRTIWVRKDGICERGAVLNGAIDTGLLPVSLQAKHKIIIHEDNLQYCLSLHDLLWLFQKGWRFYYAPFFLGKACIKIAQYSYLIRYYNPLAIITTSEYSFCSSMLTAFCETKNIEHINVMHGEKGWIIVDAFFKFSKCYVWEEFYKQLFIGLKAYPDQFVIERPPKHIIMIALSKRISDARNVVKFYWASECEKNELLFIAKHLRTIQSKGYKIIIRIHPLNKYFFFKQIYPYFNEFDIEDPANVTISESVLKTEYVVGSFTTVLYEAYLMGRKLIINDFNYEYFQQIDFISVNLPHEKLSEFVKACGSRVGK